MSNVSDIYTLWLKPWHLPAGNPVDVTIREVEVRTLHPRPTETENKLVLSFVGKNRRLILNDGNANRMSDIGGEDWGAWHGLVVRLERVKFTKDKETIRVLPASTNKPLARPVAEKPQPQPARDVPANGHTHQSAEKPPATLTEKPYRFDSAASEKFWKAVQQATGNFYKNVPEMLDVIGGWFNFGLEDVYSEKLSMAVDHARIQRESKQEPVVENQDQPA